VTGDYDDALRRFEEADKRFRAAIDAGDYLEADWWPASCSAWPTKPRNSTPLCDGVT
jgi:hypothetical protein